MNELNDYQQRRLDLADTLRAVMHIARRYDDAEREREARQLLTRLASCAARKLDHVADLPVSSAWLVR